MGTALIVVLFMTYEVRALAAIFQMMKLGLRGVKDIPVVTELLCWLECCVGATPPNCQTEYSVHFLYRKSQKVCPRIWDISLGTQPGLP